MRELGRRTEAAAPAFRNSSSSLSLSDGEGDHAKHGGGAIGARSPSTAFGGPPPHEASPHREDKVAIPLVTSQRSGARIVLAAVSPEAAALGLAPGMPVTQARALVPGLDIREADPQGDRALLAALALFAARRWTPRAAIAGGDGLFLDLTGVAHLFGGEEAMCRRILQFCARAGFAARIAVAATPGAAHALARHGGGPLLFCPAGAEAQALAPLPLAALRLETRALAAARRLGVERIGEVLAMPRGPLARRLGKPFLARLDQALGAAGEAIVPVVPEDPLVAELRFAEPIATADAIAEALRLLMARLLDTLRKAGLAARAFTLSCDRVDGDVQRFVIGTARATRDGKHLLRLLAMKIDTIEPGFGLDGMRLTAGRCEPLGAEAIEGRLAGDEPPPDLAPLVDRIAGRLGPRSMFRASAIESDVPERSVRRTGPLAAPAAWPAWPRPIRLLSPPERVENVVALLPDLPPRRFTWRGRAYRVRAADGPERIHGEWWRRSGEAEAVRDYFQVEDEEGGRFWLYRRGDGVDPRTGDLSWYLHGVFG
jgi:protein ImuB